MIAALQQHPALQPPHFAPNCCAARRASAHQRPSCSPHVQPKVLLAAAAAVKSSSR
jgi:hypothetical protein